MDSNQIRQKRNDIYQKIREYERHIISQEFALRNLQTTCSHENKRLVADDWWQCPDCDAEGATHSDGNESDVD